MLNLNHRQKLASTTLGEWSSVSLETATGTYYSDAIPFNFCNGFADLIVAMSAGSLAIEYELSNDGTNFWTPYDTDGTALNSIATALTEDRWLSFAPRPAKYIRYKFVLTVSNATVTATHQHTETSGR